MFWDARMDEQNKTIMPPATLRWAEAQNLTSTKNPSSVWQNIKATGLRSPISDQQECQHQKVKAGIRGINMVLENKNTEKN